MRKHFITFESVSIRLGSALAVREVNWEIGRGEQWAILGPNGSGKSTLVRSLFGAVPVVKGKIRFYGDWSSSCHPELVEGDKNSNIVMVRQAHHDNTHPALMKDKIGYVSFELHQKLIEQEDLQQSLREFKGALDEEYTNARDVVMSGIQQGSDRSRLASLERERSGPVPTAHIEEVAEHLDISYLLDRNITALSTGEMRKILIARALMKQPKLLILDEPFDGLDEASRGSLKDTIEKLSQDLQLILITHRVDEIPACMTHVMLLKDGQVLKRGTRVEVLRDEDMNAMYGLTDTPHLSSIGRYSSLSRGDHDLDDVPEVLIKMSNVRVVYGDTVALEDLNWEMKKGEHLAILGPNGSGKSTMVKLILGENVQGYANDIWLFGKKKGAGETVWDIKQYVGVVSGELQVQYRKNMSALDVVASGFYDSIGLYHYPTKEQGVIAREWIEILGIKDLAEKNFHHLSYGQRRLVLLARAMVKSPALLILDEPCHGLDIPNRKRVLDIIEFIGSHTPTTLLFITHHREEIVPCIAHVLELKKGIKIEEGKIS